MDTISAQFSYKLGDVGNSISLEIDKLVRETVEKTAKQYGYTSELLWQECSIDKPQHRNIRTIGIDIEYDGDILWDALEDIRTSVSIATKYIVKSEFEGETDIMIEAYEEKLRALCELIISVKDSAVGNAQYLSQYGIRDLALASADSVWEMVGVIERAKLEAPAYFEELENSQPKKVTKITTEYGTDFTFETDETLPTFFYGCKVRWRLLVKNMIELGVDTIGHNYEDFVVESVEVDEEGNETWGLGT